MGYRWGKFQGITCVLIGCSLLFVGGFQAWEEGATDTLTAWFGGLAFCATGIGLLVRRRFGVVLVCIQFALTLLLPLIGHRPKYSEGYLFHAAGLLFWGIPAALYYPKRWKDLR